jgi:hypothetical protein
MMQGICPNVFSLYSNFVLPTQKEEHEKYEIMKECRCSISPFLSCTLIYNKLIPTGIIAALLALASTCMNLYFMCI